MKSIVISGTSGGIGSALAARFLKSGYKVIGIDCVAPQESHRNFNFVNVDLVQYSNDSEYRSQANRHVRHACSDTELYALINNAAVQKLGAFEELNQADWEKTMRVNLFAPVELIRECLPMLSRHRGSVINIASIHAQLSKPGFSAYATSKAALLGLTSSLAVELGGRIQVMAICPAAISTPMLTAGFESSPEAIAKLESFHPANCIGSPSELAELALTMIAGATPFHNGMVVNFDGGVSRRLHDPE